MKRFGFLGILGLSFLSLVPTVEALNNTYQCTAKAETSVGYAPASTRVETEAGKVKKPYSVRLAGVVTGATVLHAQQVVPLVKLVDTRNVIWFSEKASAGTVIIWTLFEKDDIRPVTLISTKSYDFSGAVSFTAFYTCN
jgi:hypothetical protein